MIFNRFVSAVSAKSIFFQGSAILALTTLLSYGAALARDRFLARTFGASVNLDAYNAAFDVPDLILNIFVAGALTAAFVPIISAIFKKGEVAEAHEFINSVLNGSLLTVLLFGAAVFLFAENISHLTVPGFNNEGREIYVRLTRLLLLSPLIFSVSNLLGNILVSQQRFFWYGISAFFNNLGVIIGIIFLAPKFGITGVALGAIGGAVFHLIPRLICLPEVAANFRLKLAINDNYKTFLKIMLPKMIGHPMEKLTFIAFAALASTISAGSIAIMKFARNFQAIPINLIGITFSLTIFPVLSRAIAANNRKVFGDELAFTAKTILLITVPVSAGIYIMKTPIIDFFLGGGNFGPEDVRVTASLLGLFALSIPSESLVHLLARAFYSLKNSFLPVVLSVIGAAISIILAFVLIKHIGIAALPIGFLAGSLVETIMLAYFLRKKTAAIPYSDH